MSPVLCRTAQFHKQSEATGRAHSLHVLTVVSLCLGALLVGCNQTPPPIERAKPVFYPPLPQRPRIQFLRTLSMASDIEPAAGGLQSFVVGEGADRKRFENVSKANLCVRSEYFNSLFRAGTSERTAAAVPVPHASPSAFGTLLKYLLTDQLELTSLRHAFDTVALAKMYLVSVVSSLRA